MCVQARAEELSEHEEQLEAWKQKFKAEALRQIGEREKTLADWQAKLDRKRTDLEEVQRSMEVWLHLLLIALKTIVTVIVIRILIIYDCMIII